MKNCPCGSVLTYVECCERIHKGTSTANTAEELMRSRYVAFTKADGEYLLKSHHASTRPVSDMNEIISWAKSVKWQKLDILHTNEGGMEDFSGTVEFKAYFKFKGKKDLIHENSRFIKEYGIWYYVERL